MVQITDDRPSRALGLGLPLAWLVPGVVCLIVVAGCALKRPSWGNPGTSQQQQMRATLYDPYADNDVAPEVVGGRPRDYSKQTPEPVRADGFRETRWPF